MTNEEQIPVAWACLWCRTPVPFQLKIGTTTQLAKRDATCPGCDARIGMELLVAGDGIKLHYKKLSPGRAGRLEITQVDDQLAPSLVGRPLMSDDELALRRDGAWLPGTFAWDGSDEGHATLTLTEGGEAVALDTTTDILRWPS